MYSEEIKTTLANRIGFGTPQEAGFTIELSEANSIGASGRKFSNFHSLVTVENIFAGIPELSGDAAAKNTAFNLVLADYRMAAVLEALPLILDKHPDYVSDNDYDDLITQNITLFDDAIGYKTAMMVLEMLVSTKRKNLAEINIKLAASSLKLELYGFKNENGHLIATGIYQLYLQSIKSAQKKLFPFKTIIKGDQIW